MKLTRREFLLAAGGGLLVSGCATRTRYVDMNSTAASRELITSPDRLDIQDFDQAADEMMESLKNNWINAGKLHSAVPNQPALLAISRIENDTSQQLDTDLLVKKIRVELNRTGKVVTSTTIGLGGPEDPLAAEEQKERQFLNDQKHPRLPDYTLSGKIIEQRERAGRLRQTAFIFQLSLSNPSGIAVWEDERTIVKQGKRPSVGF